MHQRLALLAGCILVGVIALGTAWAWLHFTGARSLSAGAVIACTAISVTVALVVEAVTERILRRGRPGRAHARPTPTQTRKDTPAT